MAGLQINSSKSKPKMSPAGSKKRTKKMKTYVDSNPELSVSGSCITFTTKEPFNWYKAAERFYFDAVDPEDPDHTVDWKEHESKNPATGCPRDTQIKYTNKLVGLSVMLKIYDRTHNITLVYPNWDSK